MKDKESCEQLILKAALSQARSSSSDLREPDSPYGSGAEEASVLTVRNVLEAAGGRQNAPGAEDMSADEGGRRRNIAILETEEQADLPDGPELRTRGREYADREIRTVDHVSEGNPDPAKASADNTAGDEAGSLREKRKQDCFDIEIPEWDDFDI